MNTDKNHTLFNIILLTMFTAIITQNILIADV